MTFLIPFAATFVLVFVVGNQAALPDVGKCTFIEYYCKARNCETDFFIERRKDPKGSCSAQHDEMLNCATNTLNSCSDANLPSSLMKAQIEQNFGVDLLCTKGAVDTPANIFGKLLPTLPCSGSFNNESSACVKNYHEKFIANASDPALCKGQADAKKCLKNLMKSDCSFPSQIQEIFDLSLSDHNPFCTNKRDPGATGNEICDDVVVNTRDSSAGRISSALKALVLSFLLALFLANM